MNEYQDNLWARLIQARNLFIKIGTLTTLLGYGVLSFAELRNVGMESALATLTPYIGMRFQNLRIRINKRL